MKNNRILFYLAVVIFVLVEIGIVKAKLHEVKQFKVLRILKVRNVLDSKGFSTQVSGSDEVTIKLSMKAPEAFVPKRFSIQPSDNEKVTIKLITDQSDHQTYEESDVYESTFMHDTNEDIDEFPIYEVTNNPISDTYDAIVEFFSNAYNSVVGFFSNAYNSIVGFFSGGYNSIVGFFSDGYDSTAEFFSNAYNAVAKFFSDAYNAVAKFFPDDVVKFLSNAYVFITEFVTNHISLFIGATVVSVCFFARSAVARSLGFCFGGIWRGSPASYIMSTYGGYVPVRSACAMLQSTGATRLRYSGLVIPMIAWICVYVLYFAISSYRFKGDV